MLLLTMVFDPPLASFPNREKMKAKWWRLVDTIANTYNHRCCLAGWLLADAVVAGGLSFLFLKKHGFLATNSDKGLVAHYNRLWNHATCM
jgi:hypothetical protein